MVRATIAATAVAVPAAADQSALWSEYFAERSTNRRLAERIWSRSGVKTRHAVIDPRVEDVSGWGTAARMQRYVVEALPLGKQAVAEALDQAGVAAADVGLFTVVTCTGYATPGVDVRLASGLGMSTGTQRLLVGHMGCYAAIPGLAAVNDAATARGLTGVLLCVELASLHVQAPTDDPAQIVTHALFGDAAAAVVVVPGRPGLALVGVAARTDTTYAQAMTWDVTDHGFRMTLAPEVPDVLAAQVGPLVDELLARHGVARGSVAAWAVHPGGPRILDVVAAELSLDDDAMAPSRETLRDYGNCSSPTVLIVLDAIRRTRPLRTDDYVVALAFGPGLTLYGALFRQSV